MGFLRRPSHDRLIEETAKQQLSLAEQERARSRSLGVLDRGTHPSRTGLVAVILILVLLLAAVVFLAAGLPADEDPEAAAAASGTATHETTRVRPPVWWPLEP